MTKEKEFVFYTKDDDDCICDTFIGTNKEFLENWYESDQIWIKRELGKEEKVKISTSYRLTTVK